MIASACKIKAGLDVNLTHAKFLCKPIAHNYHIYNMHKYINLVDEQAIFMIRLSHIKT